MHNEKWAQSDLRFCKNDGSKRSKNNEKEESNGLNIKEKIGTKCFKTVK